MKLKNNEPFCTFVVQPKIMMNKIVSFFIFFSTILQFKSQDRCEFKYQQKIGGHYLFSTYFEDDLKTKKEGVCQTLSNGKIYEIFGEFEKFCKQNSLAYASAQKALYTGKPIGGSVEAWSFTKI